MFKAIGRYFRALGYMLVGKIDAARTSLSTDPNVVRATFDHVVQDKKKRVHEYKSAIAGLIAQEERKKADLKHQTEEVARLGKLKEGAAAMARKVVQRHNGDVEAVKADPEYIKCQAAFKDFGSTLEEKETRCATLEEDIKTIGRSVGEHKHQLELVMREMEKIKQEKHETVADMITAKEEKELADMISGISEDRTSQELEEMRDLRRKVKAEARVSREVAGIDVQRSEQEFLEYAAQSAADSEFDALIGLTKEGPEDREEGPADKTRLPES